MPARKLINYLDSENIRYVTLEHSPAFTAQEVAESAHIRGHKLAKTVVIDIDNTLAMLVMPASYRADTEELKRSIKGFKLQLCSERQFSELFPGCELGALPPFGNLYGMEVYIARDLTQEPDIIFCAGTHSELIRMEYSDYQRLVRPVVIEHGASPTGATPPRMHSQGLHFH